MGSVLIQDTTGVWKTASFGKVWAIMAVGEQIHSRYEVVGHAIRLHADEHRTIRLHAIRLHANGHG